MHTLAHCHSMHSVSPTALVLSPATLSGAGWKHAAQLSSLPLRRTVSLLGSVADVHGCGATRRCRYGVRSAVAMSPNTAGVGLLLAGIPLTMVEQDSATFHAQLVDGLTSLGGEVAEALGRVRVEHPTEVEMRLQPTDRPSAGSNTSCEREADESVGWVHIVVRTLEEDRGVGSVVDAVDHVSIVAWALTTALQSIAREEVLHPLGVRILGAQLLANASPVPALSWDDMESQDDPARRDSVGQYLTDVRKVWWKSSESPGEGPVLCVTKWINHGLSMFGPSGAIKQPARFIEEEAQILSAFKHENILPLIGLLPADQLRPTALLMPDMANGSLRHFLRTRRAKSATQRIRASLVVDVATGIAFLHAHNMWHGDVAARNILVSDLLLCKIANVGHHVGPSRWSAPEIFRGDSPSAPSDVWSLGVLVLEIMSNGRLPFPDHDSISAVGEFVMGGGQPLPPRGCALDVSRRLMLRCWTDQATDRPSAISVKKNALIVGGVEWGRPFPIDAETTAANVQSFRHTHASSPELYDTPIEEVEGVAPPTLHLPLLRSNSIAPIVVSPQKAAQAAAELEVTTDVPIVSDGDLVSDGNVPLRVDEHRLFDLDRYNPPWIPTRTSCIRTRATFSSSVTRHVSNARVAAVTHHAVPGHTGRARWRKSKKLPRRGAIVLNAVAPSNDA
eukprot:m.278835 g.278835  ORF g.278835 m.278835 type:complete len:676 (+) comp26957_c0_seq10:38-2065(+)